MNEDIKKIKRRKLGRNITIILIFVLIIICLLQSMVLAIKGEPEITLTVGEDYLEQGAISSFARTNLSELIRIDSSNIDTSKPGTYEVLYEVPIKYLGILTAKRKVIVIDTTPPELVLRGNDPLDVFEGDTYLEPGAKAFDNADGDISGNIKISGNVDTSRIGTYTITYTITDSSGNICTITRTVNVVASENPIISLKGYSVEYLEAKTPYSEAGFTAIDKIDGDISNKVVITGNVNVDALGSYNLTYTVTNSKGKSNEAIRTVVVRDTQKPDLLLNGDAVIRIYKNNEYIEQGATAFDNYDGNLANKVKISGIVNTNVPGIYFITYEVSDSSLNKKQIQRKVIVEEKFDNTGGNTENPEEYTDTDDDIDEIARPPEEVIPSPTITSIIRTSSSAKIAAIDELYEIVAYAITSDITTPDNWVSIPPTYSFSTNITGLSIETSYYVWIKNAASGITRELFSTLGTIIPIYTKEHLEKLGSNEVVAVFPDEEYRFSTNSSYRLENDIDLSGFNWAPLPTFYGTFDGNNKKISNLTINSNRTYVGLFTTNNGTIENLYLENVNITNTTTSGGTVYVGGIAATLGGSGSTISNCYVTGSIADTKSLHGTSSGINYTGGIVGSSGSGTISGCYNTANISDIEEGSNNISGSGARHNQIGGIVGGTSSTTIRNCFNTGNITGINDVLTITGGGSTASYTGGIAGYSSSGSLSTSYNIGNVSSNKSNIGGLIRLGFINFTTKLLLV